MKKWTALILSLVMCLSLCACGGGKTAETTPNDTTATGSGEELWVIQYTVDEFGDASQDSVPVIQSLFEGDFSNSATNSSPLSANVAFIMSYDGIGHSMILQLQEYRNTPVTVYQSEAEDIVMMTKTESDRADYSLIWSETDRLFILDESEAIFDALKSQEDVRCIIKCGSSQYNFTLEAANFPDVCSEFDGMLSDYEASYSLSDALLDLLQEQRVDTAVSYFAENMESYRVLSQDEVESLFNGRFLKISPTKDLVFTYRTVYDYLDGAQTQIGRFEHGFYEPTSHSSHPFTIEDGTITVHGGNNSIISQNQIRAITDGCYLLLNDDGFGNYTEVDDVLICYGDAVTQDDAVFNFFENESLVDKTTFESFIVIEDAN